MFDCTAVAYRPSMGGRSSAIVVMASCIAVLAACTPPPAPSMPLPPPGLERFYAQQLSWGPCVPFVSSDSDRRTFARLELDCARLEVPLDYSAPAARTAQIAIMRQRATGQRIGSLVINPGGPGSSGLREVAAGLIDGGPVAERFDVIGFDPRGVGASTPAVQCLSDQEWATERADLDIDPTPQGVAQTEAENRTFAERCAQRSGLDLLANVGTRDVVKDLDVLRAVLGDAKLTYAGFSYGTWIGEQYAEAFPANVRALVLDGAHRPTGWAFAHGAALVGFQSAFEAYASDCVRKPDCPLGADPTRAAARLQALLEQLIADPVPVEIGTSPPLHYGEATSAIAHFLRSPKDWQLLTNGLTQLASGDGSIFKVRSHIVGGVESGVEARMAVSCVDAPRPPERAELETALRDAYQRNSFAYAGMEPVAALGACAFWPVPRTGPEMMRPVAGIPPLLIVSTTGDLATPYDTGVEMAALQGATLLTVDAVQHTASFQGVACVDDVVARYLIDLVLPPSPPTCVIPAS